MAEVGCSPRAGQLDRRERLRKLALETVDLNKDPCYEEPLGSYECKLCLTLHNTEGITWPARREAPPTEFSKTSLQGCDAPLSYRTSQVRRKAPRHQDRAAGLQGHEVAGCESGQRALLFEVDYRSGFDGAAAARFMSAYEQRVEPPDRTTSIYCLRAATRDDRF